MATTAYELRGQLNTFEAEKNYDDDPGDNVWRAILWEILPEIPDTVETFDYDGMTFAYDAQLNRWDYVTAETPQGA